jgi:hypothetical protein
MFVIRYHSPFLLDSLPSGAASVAFLIIPFNLCIFLCVFETAVEINSLWREMLVPLLIKCRFLYARINAPLALLFVFSFNAF